MAGLKEEMWPDVAKATGKGMPYELYVGIEPILDHNESSKFTFGIRVGEIVGGPNHAAKWKRCRTLD